MKRLLLLAVTGILLASALSATPVYVRSTVGEPWGQTTNEAAMNQVFGTGAWTDARFESVDLTTLLTTATFLFLEGGDFTASELNSFLTANLSTLETWVNNGGRLFINAAPNEGGNINFGFGGVTLLYDGNILPNQAEAVNALHPIFNGPFTPVVTSYTGTSFAHATLSGGGLTSLILGSENGTPTGSVLGEKTWGSGLVLFGGMTTTNFHSPETEAANLRANILAYASGTEVNGVPEPSTWMMLTAGIGFAAFLRRRSA